jgi:hypothetical protein
LIGVAQELVAQDEDEVLFEKIKQLAWGQVGSGIAEGEFGAKGTRQGPNLPSFEACGWVHELVNEFLDRQKFWIPDFRHQI